MNQRYRSATLAALGCSIVASAFLAGRVLAGGVPATKAMTYAGTLEDADGTPLGGKHNIEVKLWAKVLGGTSPLCTTGSKTISLEGGHFSVQLPDDCTDAVKAKPDTWADVLVDGASLGRTKLGAVPYAVETGHATSADTASNAAEASHAANADNAANAADATGALESRLAAIEGKPAPLTDLFFDVLVPADDPNVGGFASLCVGSPNLVDCTVGANRKCRYLGYTAGWFVGESDSTYRTIVCVK